MTAEAVLYVDNDEAGAYEQIVLPENWRLHVAGAHRGLSMAMQWALASFPDEQHYGWIADDMRPRTQGWDRLLEQAAGRCFMSQANDLWVALKFPEGAAVGEPTAGQCWGGDLVRAVGWWALPGTFQGGTDAAWCRIVEELGLMRFLEDVVVEHRHWRTGKRKRDTLDTDMNDYNDHPHTARDVRLYYRWRRSQDFRRAARRARAACPGMITARPRRR